MYNDIAFALLKSKREGNMSTKVEILKKYGDETVDVLREYGYEAQIEPNSLTKDDTVFLELCGWK